jgi:hypothetical protein
MSKERIAFSFIIQYFQVFLRNSKLELLYPEGVS